MRHLRFFLAALLSVTASIEARAQAVSPGETASQLFDAAYEEMTAQRWARALELFEKSEAAESSIGARLNIARCKKELGRYAEALRDLRALAPEIPVGHDWRSKTDEAIRDLLTNVAQLRIDRPAGAPASMQVFLDGKRLGWEDLGIASPVNPGEHTIRVSAPGRENKEYSVSLDKGKTTILALDLGPLLPVVVPTDPTGPSFVQRFQPAPRSIGPTVVLGGLAALGIGGGFVALALRQNEYSRGADLLTKLESNQDNPCNDQNKASNENACRTIADSMSNADRLGTGSLILFIAGGLATAGALTYTFWPSSTPRGPETAAPSLGPIRCTPFAGPREQGLVISGSF